MDYPKLIKNIEKAYNLLRRHPQSDEIKKWLKFNNQTIKHLIKILKTTDIQHSEKLQVQAVLGILHSYGSKIKDLAKSGGNLQLGKNRSDRIVWQDVDSAFQGRIRTGAVVNLRHKDLFEFLDDAKKAFKIRIKNALKKHGSVKVNGTLYCNFELVKADEIKQELKHFVTKSQPILLSTDLDRWYQDNIYEEVLTKAEEFADRDSGWSMTEIVNLTFNINKYSPISGGTFFELPKFIQNKKAVINIQSDDEYCFLWAITAALHPATSNVCRTSSYPDPKTLLKFQGIHFPIKIKDIKKFEKMNNLAINVYSLEKKEVVPAYLSASELKIDRIHLLMLKEEELENDVLLISEDESDFSADDELNKYHFCLIKNLSRLVSSDISKKKCKYHICDRCLCHFYEENSFLRHREDCENVVKQCKMKFPSPDRALLYFKNHHCKEYVPFCVFADLETLLIDSNEVGGGVYQKHEPYSIAYYAYCAYDEKLSSFDMYEGADCIQWFIKQMRNLAVAYHNKLRMPEPMILTPEIIEKFASTDRCHICELPFTDANDIKVYDHCHLTGRVRGLAHQSCNLNYKDPTFIPVVFHRLSGYDAFFLIKDVLTLYPGKLSLLPVNKEKYISFSKSFDDLKVSLRFIDSWRHLASSLSKLADILHDDDKKITRSYYKNDEEFKLVTKKGTCPYDYLSSWDKLKETALPPKESFFSKLNNVEISDEEYSHAQKVWDTFNCKTLSDYTQVYLRTDTLLLSDIFNNYRKKCMQIFSLDPLYFCTAPALSFQAMLKFTGVQLELLRDPEMFLFIEKGLRGGLCVCSHRYSKANNKYMNEKFNPDEPSSYIQYLDVNGLYGNAMISHLPYGGFEWVNDFDLNTPDDGEYGYILEIDCETPRELFDAHKDFPMCPDHGKPPYSKQSKLLATLEPKKFHVLHYRILKLYIKLGLKVTKYHRILKFKQSPWLKKYIDTIMDLRQKSTNAFDKNFYKLCINSIFGKTLESPRKYKNIKIARSFEGRNGARAHIASPSFHSCTIISEDFILIELNKTSLMFDKPIYVGFTILDESKITMFEFFYFYLKRKFGNNVILNYTDTDSFIITVYVDDLYEHIAEDIDRFDTSSYPVDNQYKIPLVNRCVLGKMKDETHGRVVVEFVGAKPKMYAYDVMDDENTEKRLKGIKTSALKAITIDDYRKCVFKKQEKYVTQNLIRNKKLNVYTISQRKLALSHMDDKRVISQDLISTLPYGHPDAIVASCTSE